MVKAVKRIGFDRSDPEANRLAVKRGEIPQLLSSVGFDQVSEEVGEFAYALSDAAAFEQKASSCLHLIPEDAFVRGLNRLKRDLEASPVSCVSRDVVHWARKVETTFRARWSFPSKGERPESRLGQRVFDSLVTIPAAKGQEPLAESLGFCA